MIELFNCIRWRNFIHFTSTKIVSFIILISSIWPLYPKTVGSAFQEILISILGFQVFDQHK